MGIDDQVKNSSHQSMCQISEETGKHNDHEDSLENSIESDSDDDLDMDSDTNHTESHYTETESQLHEVEALLGTILSIPSENTRSLLKTLGKDPFTRRVLARVEKGTYGPSGSNVSNLPSANKSVYDHDSNANPFKVGPTKHWQQDLLTKIIAKHEPGDIDLQASSSSLFPDQVPEEDAEYKPARKSDVSKK